MKTMRRILRERSTAGALAALVALMMLLQGVFAGMAQSAMAAAATEPPGIICSVHGAVSNEPAGRENPYGKGLTCPCATLCQLASGSAAALPAGFIGLAHTISDAGFTGYFDRPAVSHVLVRGFLAQARAPPPRSI